MAKKDDEWLATLWQWWQDAIDNKDFDKAIKLAEAIEAMRDDKAKRRNR